MWNQKYYKKEFLNLYVLAKQLSEKLVVPGYLRHSIVNDTSENTAHVLPNVRILLQLDILCHQKSPK